MKASASDTPSGASTATVPAYGRTDAMDAMDGLSGPSLLVPFGTSRQHIPRSMGAAHGAHSVLDNVAMEASFRRDADLATLPIRPQALRLRPQILGPNRTNNGEVNMP